MLDSCCFQQKAIEKFRDFEAQLLEETWSSELLRS